MNTRGGFVFIFGCLLSLHSSQALAADSSPPKAVAALQQEAIALYRAGRYAEAAQRYERLARLKPADVNFLKDLMWVLWRGQRFEDAAKVAAQVCARSPKDTEGWNLIGWAKVALNKKEEAVQAFMRSLRADPTQTRLWLTVAGMHLELGDTKGALALLDELKQRDPSVPELYPLFARAEALDGNYLEAAKSWARARRLFPNQLSYHYQEAASLYQGGQRQQAARVIQQFVRQHKSKLLDKEQLPAWRAVAQLALDLEQYPLAEELLTQLVTHNPRESSLYPLLARAQTFQGSFADAAQNWAKAREAFPDQLAYSTQEVSALYRSGNPGQAIATLQKLVDQHRNRLFDPAQLPVWRSVIQLYIDLQQYDQAGLLTDQLLARYPNEGSLYPLLARVQMFQGNFAGAAQNWAKAWQFFPDKISYHHQQAVALYQSGQHDQAWQVLREFVEAHRSQLLDPEQLPVWRSATQLALDLRQYPLATDILKQLIAHNPGEASLYPLLARAQTYQGHFAEAAENWAKAEKFFPDRLSYAYQRAVALYQSGQNKEAQQVLQTLTAQHPDYALATNLLVNFYTVHNNWEDIIQLLEPQLTNPQPADELQLLLLANAYLQLGRKKQYLNTLERCLRVNPINGEALLQKAEYFQREGRLSRASRVYQQVLARNPWSFRALTGAADAAFASGHYAQAIRLIQRVRTLNPHDPYLLFSHARYLYAQGKYKESQGLLTRWLADNPPGPILPVLLYHGLTTSPDDPMLASKVHMTVDTFEDHIRALKKADFVPVTTEQVYAWYKGTAELPDKPVLITFDDARMDSFQQADPLFARYGFKATMFVPLSNVEPNFPGYAFWDDIKRYQQTGRWEIQSHGGYASDYIPIDPEGRKGLFLVNRRWILEQQRLETREEWAQRVAQDYVMARAVIMQRLGTTPVAFAYPESNFGQEGIPNTEAAPLNLEWARRTFGIIFHQDLYGLNIRTSDPALLTRLEPDQTWSGEELIRHLTTTGPWINAHLTLLRQAAWEGRLHEVRRWLSQLRQDGASQALLMVEQARLFFAAGDPVQGRAMLDRSLVQSDRTPEVEEIAKGLRESDSKWAWTATACFRQDSRHRQDVTVDQEVGSWRVGPTAFSLRDRFGWFKENGVSDVVGDGVGIATTTNLGLFHQISADVLGDFYNGGAGANLTAQGSWRAHWLDSLTTALAGGYEPVETARALNAGVTDRYVGAQGEWKSAGLWQATVSGRASSLSDSNQRYSAAVETSTALSRLPWLRFIYRFTFDNTSKISPNYYSPQQLLLNQAGAEVRRQFWKGLGLTVRYLPGYGTEKGSSSRFIHTLEVALPIEWRGKVWCTPTAFISRTPTYESNQGGLVLRINF